MNDSQRSRGFLPWLAKLPPQKVLEGIIHIENNNKGKAKV